MYPTDKDIDLYIEGKLGESEKRKFEELLNEDRDLAEKVELRKNILTSLKNLAARDTNISDFHQLGKKLLETKSEEEYLTEAEKIIDENNLEELIDPGKLKEVKAFAVENEKKSSKSIKFLNPKYLLSIAAVVIIFILLYPVINQTKPVSYQEFAENPVYFSMDEYKLKSSERGESSRGNKEIALMDTALILYDESKFGPAIEKFEKLMETDSLNDMLLFYYGVSLIKMEQYDLATDQFEKILVIENSLRKDQATRSLIWIYLLKGEGEVDKLTKYLCQYIDKDSPFTYKKSNMIDLASRLDINCE